MSSLKRSAFTFRPVTEDDAPAAHALILSDGGRDLTTCTYQEVLAWCSDHAGICALDETGRLAAVCFYKIRDLPIAAGARPEYGTKSVIYIHHQVVGRDFRRLGLGRRIGEAVVGLAFSATEGAFPSCVACTFLDNPGSLHVQRQAGMVLIPQWETTIIDSFPALRSLDTQAWETKAREGITREHALEYFRESELIRIAHWMTIAFAQPLRDATHDTILRIYDHSNGRGNFRRAMRALGRRDMVALGRLNFRSICCAA
jgi:GNAT superfamily N-acetyltransferase